jgi:hypothetical protein
LAQIHLNLRNRSVAWLDREAERVAVLIGSTQAQRTRVIEALIGHAIRTGLHVGGDLVVERGEGES